MICMLPLPPLPSSKAEVQELAARVLVATAGLAAALLLGSALVNELTGDVSRFSRLRVAYGTAMLLAALSGRWLLARHPRMSSAIVLGSALLASWLHVVATGIGLHALVLTTALFAIMLSGVLCSATVATAFAVFHVLAVLAALAAERAGLLRGMAAAADLGAGERALGQLVFTALSLMSALLLARLLERSLGRALEQESRLAELLRIGSDWHWEMTPSGRMTYLSPSFEPQTGRTVAEFLRLGQPGGPQLVADDDATALQQDLQACRPFRDRRVNFSCTDGTELSVVTHGDPVLDAQGGLVGWRGLSRNVTSERQAHRAQGRTRQLLDRLVHMSPDAICVGRMDGGAIVLANTRFLQMAGLREDQVIGRSAVELGLWPDPTVAVRLRDALLRDGQVRDLRTLVHLADGQVRPMMLTAARFEWDQDNVVVITTRDVSDIERARAEADAILEHASVGIALVRGHRFERVNPPFEAVFGRAPGSLAGQPTSVLFPAARDHATIMRRSGRAQADDGPIDIECEAARPDGTRLLVRLRARPVDAERPHEQGAIWVAEDITERRRAETELAEAKQQAEAASQAKSAFLATMSHEIRTPLNGVLGLARLMQDDSLPPQRRHEYLGHLVAAAELLSGIVSDVLDLSKIEAGHLQIESIGFDLHAVVHSTFSTFATLGRERGLHMRCQVDADVPHRVRGDPVRVRQILANYLGNALKFTQRGEVGLRVRRGAQGQVRLEVRDTGPGVDDAVREQLFRPFAQADSSTTRRYGGTGLGLSICLELAARMGGEVGVHDNAGGGSCFWAELSLPAETRGGTAATASPAPDTLPLAGLRVLVAEDNPVNMLIVGALLRRLGADVHEAEDGEQAVHAVLQGDVDPHVVLMDLHMPVLDGLQATRRLRADPRAAQLPIHALSAAVLDQERLDANEAGMNGFIAKPVIEAELLRVLRPLVPPWLQAAD